MSKKNRIAFKIIKIILSIIIIIVGIFLAMTYKALFVNQKEEAKVETEIEKIELKRISTYNKPIVPERFKKVETETASWEEIEGIPIGWNNGLVIEDEKGNQFVWVPVKRLLYNEKITDKDLDFKQNYQYGGFYIARYEAGIPEEYIEKISENEFRTTSNNKVGVPTSKKDQLPWNYIYWSRANESAENMYADNEYVTSDLITMRQWEYTSNWLAECGYNVENCVEWGNYSNVNFSFTGYYSTDGKTYKYAENGMKQTYNMILSTGATERNKANNIYDLAGNLVEFIDVNESSNNCEVRGGYYDNISTYGVADESRGLSISEGNERQGFRVVLYMK